MPSPSAVVLCDESWKKVAFTVTCIELCTTSYSCVLIRRWNIGRRKGISHTYHLIPFLHKRGHFSSSVPGSVRKCEDKHKTEFTFLHKACGLITTTFSSIVVPRAVPSGYSTQSNENGSPGKCTRILSIMEIVEEEGTSPSPLAAIMSTEKDGFLKFPRAGHINASMVHSFSMETIAPLSGSHLLSDESVEDSHVNRDHTGKDSRQDSPPNMTKKFETDDDEDEMIIDCDESDGVCLHHPEVAAFHRDHAGFIISPRKRQMFSQGDLSRLNDSATTSGTTITLPAVSALHESSSVHDMLESTDGITSSNKGSSPIEGPVALAPRFSQPPRQGPTTPLEWSRSFLSSRSMSGDGTVEAGSPTSTTARDFLREIPCPSIPIEAVGSNCSAPGSFLAGGGGEEGAFGSVYGQESSGSTAFPSSLQRSSFLSRSAEKPFLCRSLAWSQDSLDERRNSKRARKDGMDDRSGPQGLDSSLMSSSIASTWNQLQLEERREEPSPLLVHWEEKVVDSVDLKDCATINKSTPSFYFDAGSPTTASTSEGCKSRVPPPIMAAASASHYSFDSC